MKWKRMLALLGWSMGALTTSPVSLAEQRLTAKLETPYASDSKRSAIVKLTFAQHRGRTGCHHEMGHSIRHVRRTPSEIPVRSKERRG